MTDYQLEDRIRAEVFHAEKRAQFVEHALQQERAAHDALKAEHAQLQQDHAALKDMSK